MRFRFRVSDPSVVPWLPIWKRRVIAIYKSGVRWYDHYEDLGVYVVQLRINMDDVYVNLIGRGYAYFEFHTSGRPVTIGSMSEGGYTLSQYKTAVIGVTIDIAKSGSTPQSELIGGAKTYDVSSIGPLYRPGQVDLVDEPVYYPGPQSTTLGYPDMMFESFSPVHSHTGVFSRAYWCGYLMDYYNDFIVAGSIPANDTRDVLYDIPYMDGSGKAPVRIAELTDSTFDWPRATGKQTVVSETYGSRTFAILVDAYDQVSVFPTSVITAYEGIDPGTGYPKQNVASMYIKTSRVPFPAWVYKKTQKFKDYYAATSGDRGLLAFPEYDWKLHPDGTKMCSIVYERYLAELDHTYFDPYATVTGTPPNESGPGTYYPTDASFALFNSEVMGYFSMWGFGSGLDTDEYYVSAPGLLEVDIQIAITGPNPEDYTLTLSATEVRRPTTTPYCTFVAGYVFYDIKDPNSPPDQPQQYYTHRGDLCVVDIENYGRISDGIHTSLWSVKNLTANKEVTTFGGSCLASVELTNYAFGSLFSGASKMLAYNMQTLSFAMRHENVDFDDIGGTGTHRTCHFGISVYIKGQYETTLFPDSMDPTIQTEIDSIAGADSRTSMLAVFGDTLELLPLNDMRDWTDTELERLRNNKCKDYLYNPTYPYTPPIEPFGNTQLPWYVRAWFGPMPTPAPSDDTIRWFDHCMRGTRFQPFPCLYLPEPHFGWYLYQGMIITSLNTTALTTFFVHPNGTWALYDHQYIYNKNGVTVDTDGSRIAELNTANLEHCIFDRVHFNVPASATEFTLDTTFRELYNNAVTTGIANLTITDDSTTITKAQLQASFTVEEEADSSNADITYARLKAEWYPYTPYSAYYKVDHAYYEKVGGPPIGTAVHDVGMAPGQCFSPSFAGPWQTEAGVLSFVDPLFWNQSVRFSSCVMITT